MATKAKGKAEAPKEPAPKVETPKAEAPKEQAPEIETSKAEAPKEQAPEIETSKAEAPKEQAPEIETPKAEAPEMSAEEWAAHIKAKAKRQLEAVLAANETKVETPAEAEEETEA